MKVLFTLAGVQARCLFRYMIFLIFTLFLITPQISYAINDGLVGWWKFDEGSGTSAADSSGNGNAGTLNGPTWVSSRRGNALSFDGNNDSINIPLPTFSSLFTFALWVKINDYGGGNKVWISSNGGTELYLGADSSQMFYQAGRYFDSNYLVIGSFVHEAYVVSGGNITLYINGVNKETKAFASESYTGFQVGEGLGAFDFSEILDDDRLYNRALTLSEIAMVANNRNQVRNAQINNGSIK